MRHLSSHLDQGTFTVYIKTSKTANSTVVILMKKKLIFVMCHNTFTKCGDQILIKSNKWSEHCLRSSYKTQGNRSLADLDKICERESVTQRAAGRYYRWNVHSFVLSLHSALDAAVGVRYIPPSLAGLAAGCVCFFANYLVERTNVIHWQHERQRNLWRCRAVCYNSGICQLSVVSVVYFSPKPETICWFVS